MFHFKVLERLVGALLVVSLLIAVCSSCFMIVTAEMPFSYKTVGEYTVDGESYIVAELSQDYKEFKKGFFFFLNSEGRIVTDSELLEKLILIFQIQQGGTISSLRDCAESNLKVIKSYYDVYSSIYLSEKVGSIAGKGSMLALSFLSKDPIVILESTLDLTEEGIPSPEAAIYNSVLLIYSQNTVAYANKVLNMTQEDLTDYDQLILYLDAIDSAFASLQIVQEIAADDINEAASTNIVKELGKYFKNVFVSMAEGFLDNFKIAEIIYNATQKAVNIGELVTDIGIASRYDAYKSSYLGERMRSKDVSVSVKNIQKIAEYTGGSLLGDLFANNYTNTGSYAKDILGVALTQEGYIELDSATGKPLYNDNSGKWYSKYGDRYGDPGGQWCAYFVMWCAAEAGISTDVYPQNRAYGNCNALMNWFKDRGQWRNSSYVPSAGDIVFFDPNGDGKPSHMGIVERVNANGSIDVIQGNTPVNGAYQVAIKTHTKEILGYAQLEFSYGDFENSFIVEGGKTVGKAYMLPDRNAKTAWYVFTDDQCVTLCYDENTDFYLLLYPFLNTGRYVIAYVPSNIVSMYAEPYTYIPTTEEYYDINQLVVLTKDVTAYHDTSKAPLMNGSLDVSKRAQWKEGTVVNVLFEYNEFYFVTTDTQSGFVPLDDIDLDNIYEEEDPAPETPTPETPTPETPVPETPTPETPQEIIYGDLDFDGTITENDGKLILEHCADLSRLDEYQMISADANKDGVVNVSDASYIFINLIDTEG